MYVAKMFLLLCVLLSETFILASIPITFLQFSGRSFFFNECGNFIYQIALENTSFQIFMGIK